MTLNHAIHRLMVLGAIVPDPDVVWLGTVEEETAHPLALTRIEPANLPHVAVGLQLDISRTLGTFASSRNSRRQWLTRFAKSHRTQPNGSSPG